MPHLAMMRSSDLSDVRGQETAKRAMEIAAAGGHHVLLMGPRGSGKTMLAERFADLLPALTREELEESSAIYRAAGLLSPNATLSGRPKRSPPPTASPASLVGDDLATHPGEIALAHNGILLIEDADRFSPRALAAIRSGVDRQEVRPNQLTRRPARVQVLITLNPCACGYGGVGPEDCQQAPRCSSLHRLRSAGWLLELAELQFTMGPAFQSELARRTGPAETPEARRRVLVARHRQLERGILNTDLASYDLAAVCGMSEAARQLLERAAEPMGLTGRDWNTALKVARTIADLDEVEIIQRVHIAEALIYRIHPARYAAQREKAARPG